MWPVTAPITYAYVPLDSENVIVLVVEVWVVPFRVTDHDVPVGSPVSVKLTGYVGGGGAWPPVDIIGMVPWMRLLT